MKNGNELLEKEIETIKKIVSIISPYLPYKNEWVYETIFFYLRNCIPRDVTHLILENLDKLRQIFGIEEELTEKQKEERDIVLFNYFLLCAFRIPLLVLEKEGEKEFSKIIKNAILEVRNKFFGKFLEENSSILGEEIYSKFMNFEIENGIDIENFIYEEFFKYIGNKHNYVEYLHEIFKQIHMALYEEAREDMFIEDISKLYDEIADMIIMDILKFFDPITKDIEKIIISIMEKGGEEK